MKERVETAAEFIERQRERWTRNPWVKSKDIQRNGSHWWRREAFTFYPQSNYPRKVLVIERLAWDRFEPDSNGRPIREHRVGEREYRVGYFVVSRKGKWSWGQFAAFIPEGDFAALFELARREGTIL